MSTLLLLQQSAKCCQQAGLPKPRAPLFACQLLWRCTSDATSSARPELRPANLPCPQAFDELLLLKPGGATIYFGPMGDESDRLISYFEARACFLTGQQRDGMGGHVKGA